MFIFSKKRIAASSLIMLLLFTLVGGRVSYIMLTEESEDQVASQFNQHLLFYPRGEILDRRGIVISGQAEYDDYRKMYIKSYDPVVGQDIIGELDYDYNNTTATGVKGVSGLQLSYDEKLNGGPPVKISAYTDARSNIVNDSKSVFGNNINEGISLKTTLDYHIQKIVEEELKTAIEDNGYKGIAAVVSEVNSGDIVAMASEGDYTNKALLSYQPGSVFKILVFGKALELGLIDLDTPFTCEGSVDIDGVIKNCYNLEGHGEIDIKEAFAVSCNIAAYEVASMIHDYDPGEDTEENVETEDEEAIKNREDTQEGSEREKEQNSGENQLLTLAKEFGFKEEGELKIKELPMSDANYGPMIPSKIFNNLDIFNLALGQGKVMASPLTITKIVQTIANDGIYIEPRIILEEKNPLGDIIEIEAEEKKIFSKEVNDKLKILLEEVAKTGTGRDNSLAEYGGMAGKSGTAQHISGKENHGWFTAYFPIEKPVYAMTVFVEEGGVSSDTALPIFDQIALRILQEIILVEPNLVPKNE